MLSNSFALKRKRKHVKPTVSRATSIMSDNHKRADQPQASVASTQEQQEQEQISKYQMQIKQF